MLSDVEGGPVTVIEAMASKTPVLATNIGVVQDIGEDKKNIILIDNKNSKDILQKILYYKEHQTELDDIINNAYKTAQNMTYDKTFAPLEQVYNKFLYGRKLTGALLDFDTLNKHFMRKAYSVQDEKNREITFLGNYSVYLEILRFVSFISSEYRFFPLVKEQKER